MTVLTRPDIRPLAPLEERRRRILVAAEHCFVRTGFHKTTMQDVAAEARMSAGNVYRYFPSKDAIVEGLVARDRAEVRSGFEHLRADDLEGSLAALVRDQVIERGRDTAILRLEICAEATRNPAVAGVVDAFEAEVADRLVAVFAAALANRSGERGTGRTARTLAELVITFLSGVMLNLATGGGTAMAERRLADLLAILGAALDGTLTLPAHPEPGEGAVP